MKRIALLFALLISLTAGIPARAQEGAPDFLPGLENAPPFVADVKVTNAQVKGAQYRMYYMPGYMRLESTSALPGGEKQVILSHLRENVSFVDIGGQWFKVDNNALGAEGLQYGSTSGFRVQKLGKRTVLGRLCEGYRMTSPDGATRVEQWLTGDYPVLATVQNKMGTTTAEYLSLRPQSTPMSYFSPPKGQPVQDLGALTGGGGSQGGGLPQGLSQQELQKLLQGQ